MYGLGLNGGVFLGGLGGSLAPGALALWLFGSLALRFSDSLVSTHPGFLWHN